MNISSIFKHRGKKEYLKMQFYIIEEDGNGFIFDSTGSPLYRANEIGIPWIGTEKMLPQQLRFISDIYEIKYGKKVKEIIPQEYEGRDYG